MARAALLAMLGVLAGCDPSVVKLTCLSLDAQELNEPEVCLGPPVTPTGLTVCPTSAFPTGEEEPVCVVGPDARVYRAAIAPSATIKGTGWTHSAYVGAASTLTAADAERCAKVLPSDAGTVPACP